MPRRRKELTPDIRARICELNSIGWKLTWIHKRYPHIPYTIIQSTIKQENTRKNQQTLPRSGRPKKISAEEQQHLLDLVEQDQHIKMCELSEAVQSSPSVRTVQRLFRTLHMQKWKQCERPEITPENAEMRLRWAQSYAEYTAEDFNRVIWSDECSVERGAGVRWIYTFRSPKQQIIERDIRAIRCGKGVKQMFWAAFGFNRWTGLLPLGGDPESACGGVTAWVIRGVYESFLPEILGPGDIFMHDGASVHRAYIVRDLLQQMGVEVMVWPPYSPDLNPIENLWAIMKGKIYELYPELERAPDTEDTLQTLIQAAIEAWHAIDECRPYNTARTSFHSASTRSFDIPHFPNSA
jgi:transposase